jgi:hypothetical protein
MRILLLRKLKIYQMKLNLLMKVMVGIPVRILMKMPMRILMNLLKKIPRKRMK